MPLQVTAYLGLSLDGFIAGEDGSLDFLASCHVEGEDYGYASFFATVDTLVVGRSTYETVLGFPEWPWTGKRVVVMTHRPVEGRAEEERAEGDLAPLLARLAEEGVRSVYLDGGVVVRQGLREGVVTELVLSVVPQLLGRGRPLFGPEVPASSWLLRSAQAYPSGLVQLRYTRPD